MKSKKLKYSELREVLVGLGYTEQITKSNHIVFRHPKSHLPIFLPRMRSNAIVPPIEILSIRNVLNNAGFWDSLLRQTGTESPAEATHVFQMLAGTMTERSPEQVGIGGLHHAVENLPEAV